MIRMMVAVSLEQHLERDYISQGMRARAAHLATLELGPRSDLEIRHDLQAQVEADRWTRLDRVLAREAAQHDAVVDLRPGADAPAGEYARTAMIGRMRKLERLGLAEPLGPSRWHLSENAEPVMRALGECSDMITWRLRRAAALGLSGTPPSPTTPSKPPSQASQGRQQIAAR